MIRLEGVSKRFGTIEALAPLDLEIRDGEWLGVFGRNGSGKTSLLRILVGLSQPSSGRVLLHDTVPTPEDWRQLRRSLGFMPERISLFENLTGERTLRYFATLKGVPMTEVEPLLERVGLTHAARRRLAGYSKGMLQRLNLAQALLGDPRLVVVDEPIEGLDAHGVQDFFDMLRAAEGRTVVFSSHRLPQVSRFVDRICVLSQGKVAALGTEDELHRALNLPVRIIVRPSADSNGNLAAAFARYDFASVTHLDGRLVVQVPQRKKLRFLAGLEALEASIDDVRIEEPSLEEVLLETI
jgi:Cu-processing system ATP-binding protein